MTEVHYSRHAQDRMAERGISRREVEHVIRHPDTSYTDRDGYDILVGEYGGRRIKVVVKRGSDPPYVITTAPRDG